MAILETSVNVSKPVEKVFEFLTNLDYIKKLSEYITAVDVKGPIQVGTHYIIKTNTMGRTIETDNQIVALEPNKKLGVKTIAVPPATDVTNTYLLESSGGGTKLTLQMDATLVPAGMPSMPGMEDMMKKQMMTSLETSINTLKKLIEA
jgi:carbon monoxide dehydrogenase subunit G